MEKAQKSQGISVADAIAHRRNQTARAACPKSNTALPHPIDDSLFHLFTLTTSTILIQTKTESD
jgi:hypothetical protein